MTEFSGVIILDVDDTGSQPYEQVFAKTCSISTTLACVRSPKGIGFKAFVPISAGPECFEQSYLQVAEFYEKELGIKCDLKCKDISRLCFYSYDPNLYKNLDCDIFQVNPCPEIIEVDNEIQDFSINELPQGEQFKLFCKAISFTQRITQYKMGNRNNFIFLLACNCSRFGISMNEAQKLILEKKYKLNKSEILSTIKSAYENEIRNKIKGATPKNTLFSINLLNFIKYKPEIDFDIRLMFEAFIIKMLSFGGTFFLSMPMIQKEFGIKRSRAEVIISYFKSIGFIKSEVKKTIIDGQFKQMTYYTVQPKHIIETSALFFTDNKEFVRKLSPRLIRFIEPTQ